MFKIVKYCTSCICSQTWKTAQESALTSVTSERDELAEEKTDLEGKLMVLQSQTHELQVRRCMVMVTVGGLLGLTLTCVCVRTLIIIERGII